MELRRRVIIVQQEYINVNNSINLRSSNCFPGVHVNIHFVDMIMIPAGVS